MRLVLHLSPAAVVFSRPTSGEAYPFLARVGALRIAVRAGEDNALGGNETANLEVALDNRGRRVSALIGRPLRAAAEVYDDAGELFFSGTVSRCSYGATVKLDLDA